MLQVQLSVCVVLKLISFLYRTEPIRMMRHNLTQHPASTARGAWEKTMCVCVCQSGQVCLCMHVKSMQIQAVPQACSIIHQGPPVFFFSAINVAYTRLEEDEEWQSRATRERPLNSLQGLGWHKLQAGARSCSVRDQSWYWGDFLVCKYSSCFNSWCCSVYTFSYAWTFIWNCVHVTKSVTDKKVMPHNAFFICSKAEALGHLCYFLMFEYILILIKNNPLPL